MSPALTQHEKCGSQVVAAHVQCLQRAGARTAAAGRNSAARSAGQVPSRPGRAQALIVPGDI
jgi:hypothetical protein